MSVRQENSQARKLLSMATELMSVARDLEGGGNEKEATEGIKISSADTILVEVARQIYSARRKRSMLIDDDEFFGEPAWDIYLDLYIAAHERRDVSVTSACLAMTLPPTTALRWLRLMEDEGIVVRERDERDSMRSNGRLSAEAFTRMTRYFKAIAEDQPAIALKARQALASAS
jgi:hypothetical protein